MARSASQKNHDDIAVRDQVRSIDQTMRELVLPKLEEVALDVKSMVEKDYLTPDKADKMYASLQEFQRLRDKIRPVLKGLAVIGTAAAVTLMGILINFIAEGGLK